MIKIIPIKIEKIWGYEIWLNSSLEQNQTRLENGELTKEGPLIKIIKADDKLSVQVHPDDYWAQELENQDNGKSESWYVLESEKDSELIVGIKTSDNNLIKNKLNDETFEELLIKTKAEKGDFINVPAGMVHGIGKNITIFEVQQPSDITYRYFDYYRKDNNNQYRELHIEKALKVQNNLYYNIKPISTNPLTYITGNYIQKFYSNPSICLEKSIVVDLINYEAYIFDKDEEINFKKYCTINI